MCRPEGAMKSLIVTALCGAMFLGGCGEEPEPTGAEDVQREARELADTLESYTAEQKDQAVSEAREALAELEERIARVKERLAERWSDMDESAQQNVEEKLDELEEEQAQLADRFEALRDASGTAWARVREAFVDAYADLREAWREADQASRE